VEKYAFYQLTRLANCKYQPFSFTHSQIYFFDFSNNQGTFWTPGDDYLIFQIKNKQ